MSTFVKYLFFTSILFWLSACFSSDQDNKKEVTIPKKITMLFVTQPSCPSCDKLEETMNLPAPKKLLNNYFDFQKVYLGETLPDGLIEPNGTPTVYFLGADNEVLVEPMVGEKEEQVLIEFLEDALLEFKNLYHVDLQKSKPLEDNNISKENNRSEENNASIIL